MSAQSTAVPASTQEFPFSLEQEFLRLQHENDGSPGGFGPRPISSGGWRLTGELDVEVLRTALADVVARHEALRTTIESGPAGRFQKVHPPAAPTLTVSDLPRGGEEEFLNDIEASSDFELNVAPNLWVFLGRIDPRESIVVLVSHLPIVDVWSLSIVMRDIVDAYAARAMGQPPKLSDTTPYREYVAKQQETDSPARSFEYWREKLVGAKSVALRADHPPAESAPTGTRCDRFAVDAELGAATLAYAKSQRCSPFMVLFSAYRIHLQRLTGQIDGSVWTLTSGPGRRRKWMEDTVGYFVNMFPLRTDLTGCETFAQVVERVRRTCMDAFPHEVPFIRLAMEAESAIRELEQGGMVVPGFQMSPNPFVLREQSAGSLGCTAVQRRTSQEIGPDIPDDAILWTCEIGHGDELLFAINSSIDRYEHETIKDMLRDFESVLRAGVANPDAPLEL